jgi:hypothetical protein
MKTITKIILYAVAAQNGYYLNCAEEQESISHASSSSSSGQKEQSKRDEKEYARLSVAFIEHLKKSLKQLNLPQEIYKEMYYNPKEQNMFYIRHIPADVITVSDFIKIKQQSARDKSRLTNNYKIHLMPKEDEFETIILKIAKLFTNAYFTHVVNSVKIFPLYPMQLEEIKNFGPLANELVVPGIIMYADSKKNAQGALNFLYKELAEFQGINVHPRFSAQITNLIYITQGDGDYKTDPLFQRFYEKPDKIYYNPITIGEPAKNYHLVYPNTDIEVVSSMPQENPKASDYSVKPLQITNRKLIELYTTLIAHDRTDLDALAKQAIAKKISFNEHDYEDNFSSIKFKNRFYYFIHKINVEQINTLYKGQHILEKKVAPFLQELLLKYDPDYINIPWYIGQKSWQSYISQEKIPKIIIPLGVIIAIITDKITTENPGKMYSLFREIGHIKHNHAAQLHDLIENEDKIFSSSAKAEAAYQNLLKLHSLEADQNIPSQLSFLQQALTDLKHAYDATKNPDFLERIEAITQRIETLP